MNKRTNFSLTRPSRFWFSLARPAHNGAIYSSVERGMAPLHYAVPRRERAALRSALVQGWAGLADIVLRLTPWGCRDVQIPKQNSWPLYSVVLFLFRSFHFGSFHHLLSGTRSWWYSRHISLRVWSDGWLFGVHRTRRDGSGFTWHQPMQQLNSALCTPLWWYSKCAINS